MLSVRSRLGPTMSVRARLLVLSGVVLVGVAVAGSVLFSTFSAQRNALQEQHHLLRASASQGALLAGYIDQDTALHDYLLAEQSQFLDPYTQAANSIPRLTSDLTAAVADHPTLASDTSAMVAGYQRWQQQALLPELALARAKDMPAARALEAGGQGKLLFDALRAMAGALSTELRFRSIQAGKHVAALSTLQSELLVSALAGLVVLVAIQLLGTMRLLVAPLLRLGHDVRIVASGTLDHPVRATGPREFATVGRGTEAMRLRLLAELEQVLRGQEALAQSGPAVLALQAALTPTPAEVPNLSIAYRLVAAEGILAGDWLDTLVLPGDRLGVILGDVSGHGPGPAVFALRLKHMLAAALTAGRSPGGSIAWTARHLGDTDELFATVFVAVLDPGTQQLTYANAGHPDALLIRAGTAPPRTLPPTGPLLSGLVAGWGWGDTEHAFTPGDALFSYTDGLIEARDAAGQEFGVERLQAAFLAGNQADLPGLLEAAVQQVRAFSRRRLTDDCTMIACRYLAREFPAANPDIETATASSPVAG